MKKNYIINGYNFDLVMKSNLLLVCGNSGVGRTMIYNHFVDLSLKDMGIICFNADRIEHLSRDNGISHEECMLELIGDVDHKLIVIDNADLILTDNMRSHISFDTTNNYLIFGRNVTGFFINENRLAYLTRDDKVYKFNLDYRYEGLFR